MKKSKIFLCCAIGCILAGGILFGGGIVLGGSPQFSITKTGLHLKNEETEEGYVLSKTQIDSFTDISMKVDYADVEILPSDDQKFYMEYTLSANSSKPEMKVENGRLVFKEQEESGIFAINFSFIGIYEDTRNYSVKLYVPADRKLGKVQIDNGSGNIKFQELQAEESIIKAGYGDLVFDGYTGKKLDITAESGDVRAGKIKADEVMAYSGYGDFNVKEMKGASGEIKLESGDMKVGRSDMESLNITSGYGNVELGSTDGWESYDLELYTDYGELELNGYEVSDGMEQKLKIVKDNEKSLKVVCESGDITLS